MEKITLRTFEDPELRRVQDAAVNLARTGTDAVLSAYAARPDTFQGRYVCADSMKELMPRFGESPESRSRFNGAVHNSAAVLSSEQFNRLVQRGPQAGQDNVIFITGIPGAGKSSTVQQQGMRPDVAIIFEGQMSRPEPSMAKIEQALNAGFKVGVVAVHTPPEVALQRTNYRFNDPNNGRGASLAVMSEIQGNLPAGLAAIRGRFGDQVSLLVVDNGQERSRLHEGWEAVKLLEREGTHEHIRNRLQTALDQGYSEGRYSAGFYAQAAGREPSTGLAQGMGTGRGGGPEPDADRRSLPAADRSQGQVSSQSRAHGATEPQPAGADRLPTLQERQAYAASFDAKIASMAQAGRPPNDPELHALRTVQQEARRELLGAVVRELEPAAGVKAYPGLAGAYDVLAKAGQQMAADGLSPAQQAVAMARVRENVAQAVETGKLAEALPQQRGPER